MRKEHDEDELSAHQVSRRRLMSYALRLPVVGALAASPLALGAESAVCADPEEFSPAEAGMRRSLSYTDQAPDPKKSCAACGFFSSGEPAGCGTCKLLNDGPVDSRGYCTSWSARS